MSQLWSTYRTSVIAAYQGSAKDTDREAAAYRAIADFVRSEIVRTVEADLPLAKSFKDSYLEQKLNLAGYTITESFATVRAAVGTHITVYQSMTAISTLVDNLVQRGIDDFNGTVALFDAALTESAIDLQRYIDFYRARHLTYYADTDFDSFGQASVAQLPESARPYRLAYQIQYPELEDGTYAAGDYVRSNGNVYLVTTGGDLSAGDLADGLTSTDPDATLTLGDLEFTYQEDPPCFSTNLEPYPWKSREDLSCGSCGSALLDSDVEDYTASQFLDMRAGAYLYSIEPRGRAFWVFPKVRPYWAVMLEWDGVKTVFADSDIELFGPAEARASAHYIRSILQRTITESAQAANASMQLYVMERKKLWAEKDELRRTLL